MVEQGQSTRGHRSRLQDSSKMREQFNDFGRRGLSLRAIGLELGCGKSSVYRFFERAPDIRKIYNQGRKTASESRPASSLKPDETCPVCGTTSGQTTGKTETQITFDTAELAETRRKLETLLDRLIERRNTEKSIERAE